MNDSKNQRHRGNSRPWLPVIALLACVITPTSSVAWCEEPEFPYTLVVSRETADVLSGPGSTHYPTDRLPRGTKVEVYRHDPGGYYAIRPPVGSFSLVLASAVQPTADPGIVEVQSKTTKAWIGSRLDGEFQPMWQLKLKPGELLAVVDQVEIPGAHSRQSETWYQVEPPRGEFRWIHKDNLGPLAPASVSTAEISDRQIQRVQQEVDLLQNLGAARIQSEIVSTGRDGWKVLETGDGRPANLSANEAVFDRPPVLDTPGGFEERLAALDLSLSQMVLGPKQQWRLEPLQQLVQQMRAEALTGEELALANRLAQKILDFRKIREASLEAGGQLAERAASLLTPDLMSSGSRSADSRSIQYDGEGILRKLYTDGGRGPTLYALEDANGQVIRTISPSSGVNLERYVGKPVGLFGRAGFNQRLNRPHLTAQRVVDLDKIR